MSTSPPLRSIALPVEHGGWGLTLEPVLLGLLVAPSGAGVLLGIAALTLFLAYRPVRLLLADLRRSRHIDRTRLAALVAAGYLLAAAAALGGAASVAGAPFWWALAAPVPLIGVQFWFDARNRTRALAREVSGSLAPGGFAAAIALADGWTIGPALGLWLVLAARAAASVMLVRTQIKRTRSASYRTGPLVATHISATAAVAAAAGAGVVPWSAVAAVALLGVWAVIALRTPPVRAVVVGFTQMGVGVLVVVLTALGHHVGW